MNLILTIMPNVPARASPWRESWGIPTHQTSTWEDALLGFSAGSYLDDLNIKCLKRSPKEPHQSSQSFSPKSTCSLQKSWNLETENHGEIIKKNKKIKLWIERNSLKINLYPKEPVKELFATLPVLTHICFRLKPDRCTNAILKELESTDFAII